MMVSAGTPSCVIWTTSLTLPGGLLCSNPRVEQPPNRALLAKKIDAGPRRRSIFLNRRIIRASIFLPRKIAENGFPILSDSFSAVAPVIGRSVVAVEVPEAVAHSEIDLVAAAVLVD